MMLKRFLQASEVPSMVSSRFDNGQNNLGEAVIEIVLLPLFVLIPTMFIAIQSGWTGAVPLRSPSNEFDRHDDGT